MHGAYDTRKWQTSSNGQDVAIDVRNLPKVLRFAREVPAPWPQLPFREDFILIAEFSENEGPRPVRTIPKDGGGNFDKNSFAVHVMSVDYQAQARGSSFSIVDDTQLFLTEKKEEVYSYVHNFTLYDIHARGFVRPFCMCYISHNKKKIIDCFDKLMEEFTKVSKCFRMGNKIAFNKDLEQRLVDLNILKGTNLSLFDPKAEPDSKEGEEAAEKSKQDFECIIQETNKIIEALKPHMNDSRITQQFRQLQDLAAGREHSGLRTKSASVSHNKDAGGGTAKLSPLEAGESCTPRKASSLPDLMGSGSRETERLDLTSFRPAYLQSSKRLRDLHELCGWGAKEALHRLGSVLEHYSQDGVALSMESTEAKLLEPMPSLLAIGKSVVGNFLHGVNLKSVQLAQLCKAKPCVNPVIRSMSRNPSLGSLGSCCSSLESFQSCLDEDFPGSAHSSEAGVISPFMPSALFHTELHSTEVSEGSDTSRTDTSDYCDSLLLGVQDNLSLADSETADEQAPENSELLRQSSVTVEKPSAPVDYRARSRSLEILTLSEPDESQRPEPRGFAARFPKPVSRGRSHSGNEAAATKFPENIFNEFPLSKDGNPGLLRSPRQENRRTHSEGCSAAEPNGTRAPQRRTQHVARTEKVYLRCFAEEVCQGLETYTGSNVLLFKNTYTAGVHLISALLCGRPVAILAEPQHERDVRILISALWMFVPENRSHPRAVVPWKKKPLHILDLTWLKLVGLAKLKHTKKLPKSVERYVSLLDYETGQIFTPPYKGIFLRSIFNPKNRWPTNGVMVAYIHSVFLELMCKAYVYYYSYCLAGLCPNKSRTQICGGNIARDGSEILSELGVHFSDARIVKHLVEIIKQQQIDHHQNLTLDQGSAADALDGAPGPDTELSAEKRPGTVFTDYAKCIWF